MNELDFAYLAGAMDADGYFTIKRHTYGIRVVKDSKNPSYSERTGIKQTCDIIPKMIHKRYGGYLSTQKPNTPNGKLLYSIELGHKKAIAFLKDIFPHLKIKKRQAEILFELRESKEKPRTETHESLQKNRWGKEMIFKKHSVSKEQIKFCENLILELNTLNDIRQCKFTNTKEWKP